jgi:hypothetical protein
MQVVNANATAKIAAIFFIIVRHFPQLIALLIGLVVVSSPALSHLPNLGQMPTLAPLVREVTPCVVNISVHGRVKRKTSRVENYHRGMMDGADTCIGVSSSKLYRGGFLFRAYQAPP